MDRQKIENVAQTCGWEHPTDCETEEICDELYVSNDNDQLMADDGEITADGVLAILAWVRESESGLDKAKAMNRIALYLYHTIDNLADALAQIVVERDA